MRKTVGTNGRRRAGAALLLAASLLAAGCAGGADGAADSKGAAAAAATAPDAARQEGNTGGTGGSAGSKADGPRPDASKADASKPGSSKAPAAQHLIRTASLAVEVDRVAPAADRVRAVVAAAGGRVESETTERVDDRYDSAHLVLRVPQERYDGVLAGLAGTGKVLSRQAEAQDVTDQVVDVESRIASQRASVARVRALMDRAERLADVVTLEGELSRRQADLEALLARQASLEDRTSLATITLDLREKERVTVEDEVTDDSRPAVGDAFEGGWDALVAVVAWTLVVLAALAPWLAAALAGYAVWRWVLRPRRAARPVTAPVPAPVPAAVPGQPARRNAAGLPLPDGEPDEAAPAP
ncbi:DUF4349 domain-containing protein [Streptomyces hydrogenans]|uniref:DUF4349 domain-containing protein n=1 Tax=Streptomyces hydrogenans TaxID=1873719 RepID=UPI0019AFE36C|nr:DUF4349 domain-containing protein [Streptomyces hydrogenans]GHG15919.1 hypothetical protein GCM10018784_31300 [Streptomyces hydrogenans]